jgi:tRNA-dihydrouridine synthase B
MKKINIGSIEIEDPVFLAPMSGVSDLPFRKLVKSFGTSLVFSEMIASQAMVRAASKTLKMATSCAEEFPMAVQLAGCCPETMAEAAKLNVDRGAAIIDINYGCPAKKVALKSYAGSHLMRDELLAGRILEAVVKAVNVPVTLKMRTGWDDENRNAPKLAKIAEEAGIQMITVHGRTRCQFYHGRSDWAFIKKVKEEISLPLIANGDIITFEDAKNCLEISGADGVMIGRGTYGRPWLIAQITEYLRSGTKLPSPTLPEQLKILLTHYESIINHYGELPGIRIARKHIAWYSKGLHGSTDFRSKINRAPNAKDALNLIADFYEKAIEYETSLSEAA